MRDPAGSARCLRLESSSRFGRRGAARGNQPRSGALGEREPGSAIFREACALAGLPYFNPHSLRNTLVQIAYELKLDPESWKAWSQNCGHENCLTTFSSYGEIQPSRQAEIIRGLAKPDSSPKGEWLRSCCDKLPTSSRGLGGRYDRSRTATMNSLGAQWPLNLVDAREIDPPDGEEPTH